MLASDKLGDFVRDAVAEYIGSERYRKADIAERYFEKQNVTMENFVKTIKNEHGQDVPDTWSSNYKLKTMFFRRFVIRLTQYILSNGITFQRMDTKKKLQNRRVKIDTQTTKVLLYALVHGASYGFWDFDHVVVFHAVNNDKHPGFCPIEDAETGELMAGIRFWTAADQTRVYVLYTSDGLLRFEQKSGNDIKRGEQQAYIETTVTTKAFGTEIKNEAGYDRLPIFPMYANDSRESELLGIRESLDCYDFLKSGLANDINDSTFFYLISNAGGMDDEDLVKFVNRVRKIHAALVGGDATVEPHTVTIPTEAVQAMLTILRDDLHDDFMVLNAEKALAGDKTATAMRLAYQPQDDKCGELENQVRDFLYNLLDFLGIDDEPSFAWNRIANQYEETQMIMTASPVLPQKMIVKKLPFLTPEEAQEAEDLLAEEAMNRLEEPDTGDEDVTEDGET